MNAAKGLVGGALGSVKYSTEATKVGASSPDAAGPNQATAANPQVAAPTEAAMGDPAPASWATAVSSANGHAGQKMNVDGIKTPFKYMLWCLNIMFCFGGTCFAVICAVVALLTGLVDKEDCGSCSTVSLVFWILCPVGLFATCGLICVLRRLKSKLDETVDLMAAGCGSQEELQRKLGELLIQKLNSSQGEKYRKMMLNLGIGEEQIARLATCPPDKMKEEIANLLMGAVAARLVYMVFESVISDMYNQFIQQLMMTYLGPPWVISSILLIVGFMDTHPLLWVPRVLGFLGVVVSVGLTIAWCCFIQPGFNIILEVLLVTMKEQIFRSFGLTMSEEEVAESREKLNHPTVKYAIKLLEKTPDCMLEAAAGV